MIFIGNKIIYLYMIYCTFFILSPDYWTLSHLIFYITCYFAVDANRRNIRFYGHVDLYLSYKIGIPMKR